MPPTSEQPEYSVVYRAHIHRLDNDSLFQIFNHYRLDHKDNWTSRLRWRKLAHVCQRWRCLVFDYCSSLDVCLSITNNSRPTYGLCHFPPVPLIIEYSIQTSSMYTGLTTDFGAMPWEDKDKIHLGLQQHGYVFRADLRAPSSDLRTCLKLMNKPFPRLERLSLFSTTTEEMDLVLPETLQAPDLRRLSLHGISLPKGLSSLSSTNALSTLSLTHIRDSCYFSPVDLVTRLHGLPHLEELSIGFATPMSLPSSKGESLSAPIPPVTLPALERLTFRGMDVYLDCLIARISAPRLGRLGLTLFFDLDFTLVNLTEFIDKTEGFGRPLRRPPRRPDAQVNFNKDGASINAGYHVHQVYWDFSLRVNINCKRLDWQVASTAEVCNALGNVLSAVEELKLDFNEDWMPSDWTRTHDKTLWHELLRPFTGVKKLHVGSSLILELSRALKSVAGVLELLPDLKELDVQVQIDHAKNAFSEFVETRESVGRPVHLLAPPIPGVDYYYMKTYCIDPKVFLEDVKNIGRKYQYRAMILIFICQTFIKAQEQTFRSYEELRR